MGISVVKVLIKERFILLPHTLYYCSYFITSFINTLTTDIRIFVYSHDVYFLSILELMT
jgi:hypothetical protein